MWITLETFTKNNAVIRNLSVMWTSTRKYQFVHAVVLLLMCQDVHCENVFLMSSCCCRYVCSAGELGLTEPGNRQLKRHKRLKPATRRMEPLNDRAPKPKTLCMCKLILLIPSLETTCRDRVRLLSRISNKRRWVRPTPIGGCQTVSL